MEVVETRALGKFSQYSSIILAVFMILAVGVIGISLWLYLLGFELNFQNIMLTSGFLVALCLMLMASTDLVVLCCGLWTLYLVLYYWVQKHFLQNIFAKNIFSKTYSPKTFSPKHFFRKHFLQNIFSEIGLISSSDMDLTTTTKTTLVFLSVLTGFNLILILSSDLATVMCGYACLVLSVSCLMNIFLSSIN